MENFFNLRSFSTFGVVHTHHIQHASFDVGTLAAGTTSDTNITWGEAFPAGVTPRVLTSAYSTNATAPGGISRLQFGAFNVSNTGCTVQSRNTGAGALGAGIFCAVVAFDATYNTTDY